MLIDLLIDWFTLLPWLVVSLLMVVYCLFVVRLFCDCASRASKISAIADRMRDARFMALCSSVN